MRRYVLHVRRRQGRQSRRDADVEGRHRLEVGRASWMCARRMARAQAKRPCGTPTVWIENGVWYLFYEWNDKGVWLAKTNDPAFARLDERAGRAGAKRWARRVRQRHDRGRSGHQAPRRVFRDLSRQRQRHDRSRGRGTRILPARSISCTGRSIRAIRSWMTTNRAASSCRWQGGFRLYTMHDQVDVFESRSK